MKALSNAATIAKLDSVGFDWQGSDIAKPKCDGKHALGCCPGKKVSVLE